MHVRTMGLLFGTALVAQAAWAGKGDEALEARVKALESRVTELEAKLNATKAAPAVAPAPVAAPVAVAVPPPAVAPTAATPATPVAPTSQAMAVASTPQWKDPTHWAAIHRGLSGAQVKALLGNAGKVVTGVFGDVWYYPDDSGGRVVFDRDGRVSEFDQPPSR